MEIAAQRLFTQRLTGPPFARAEEAVAWLGAVQAQDYPGAKWALGQRTDGLTDAAVDDALAHGTILRTHILRPTWHLVMPADIRWMQELTAPRVRALLAHYDRRLEIDVPLRTRVAAILEGALRDGQQRTRTEIGRILAGEGIAASGQRLAHLLMHAELDPLICSGPLHSKQHTYALVSERAPDARPRPRDQALTKLAIRYITGHGPALVQDFAWWTGLTVTDARAGIESARPALVPETVAGATYWVAAGAVPPPDASATAHLLPNYDEFFIAYKERRDVFDPALFGGHNTPLGIFDGNVIAIDGKIAGGWRRTIMGGTVQITARLLVKLDAAHHAALDAAAEQYGRFLGLPVKLTIEDQ